MDERFVPVSFAASDIRGHDFIKLPSKSYCSTDFAFAFLIPLRLPSRNFSVTYSGKGLPINDLDIFSQCFSDLFLTCLDEENPFYVKRINKHFGGSGAYSPNCHNFLSLQAHNEAFNATEE